VGGAVDIDGLTLSSQSTRVVILGGSPGLVEAVCGLRAPSHGTLTLRDREPRVLAQEGLLASARDVPMPPKWNALEYATWSGRLAGAAEDVAKKIANDSLVRFGADPRAILGKASLETRRATLAAGALATGAEIIVLEDPLEGLAPDSARTFGRALCAELENHAWILFARALPLASPFALHAEEAIALRASRVVAQGAPAEIAALERSFSVRISGDFEAFAKRVESEGGRAPSGGIGAPASSMAVDLGEKLAVRDLFRIAEDAGAVVIEVLPLGGVFS